MVGKKILYNTSRQLKPIHSNALIYSNIFNFQLKPNGTSPNIVLALKRQKYDCSLPAKQFVGIPKIHLYMVDIVCFVFTVLDVLFQFFLKNSQQMPAYN